ncbi:MAG: rRNA maturation RNase YbeY [Candidatus Omnitrophota bacterium]
MEIIINAQRGKGLSKKRLERLSADILKMLKAPSNTLVSISFAAKSEIARLNAKYFNKKKATDVIAFEYKKKSLRGKFTGFKKSYGRDFFSGYLGDVIICPEVALENSKIYKNTFSNEITLYMIHGILHLLGYDDTRKKPKLKMQKKQEEVLAKLCC